MVVFEYFCNPFWYLFISSDNQSFKSKLTIYYNKLRLLCWCLIICVTAANIQNGDVHSTIFSHLIAHKFTIFPTDFGQICIKVYVL